MDQALESQWIAGAGQLGAEFFNGIGRLLTQLAATSGRSTGDANLVNENPVTAPLAHAPSA